MGARGRRSFDPIAETERQWHSRGWSDSAAGMTLVTSVMRVQQLFLKQVDDILRPEGLTFARYEVLVLLSFTPVGSMPLNQMAEHLQVHRTSITNAIDRLEEQGYVVRIRPPTDRRTVLATITPAGRRIAQRMTHELNEIVFGDVGLSQDDAHRCIDLLRQIRLRSGDFTTTRSASEDAPRR